MAPGASEEVQASPGGSRGLRTTVQQHVALLLKVGILQVLKEGLCRLLSDIWVWVPTRSWSETWRYSGKHPNR